MQPKGRISAILAPLLAWALFLCAADMRADSLDSANKQGERLLNQGLYAKAITAFQKAIETGTKSEGPKGANVLRVRQNLARAYGMDGQFALAEQNFKESFEGMMEAFKAGRGRVTADELGWVLVNWAGVSYSLAQFADAELRTREAMKIFEEHRLADSADQARHNLASIYCETKQYQKAIDTYSEVIEYRQRRYGARDWRTASAFAGPAVVLLKTKDYEKAESYFRRCLDGQKRDTDPETSEHLAYTLTAVGKLDEARGIYEHLLDLAEHRFGLPYRVADFKGSLARIAAYEGQWDKALRLADEAQRFIIPYRRNVALGLSDSEMLSYFNLIGGADDPISMGWARHAERGAAEMAAAWSINERGLLYESMAERVLLSRDQRLSGQAPLFEDLTEVRKQYTSQLRAGAGTRSKQEYAGEMARLMEREADLTRRIGLASLRVPPIRRFVEVSSLRGNIPADTVLVHFAKTELRSFAARGGPQGPVINPHYLAWVIPPAGKGEVTMLDIGPAEVVEKALQKWDAAREEVEAGRTEHNRRIIELNKENISDDERLARGKKKVEELRGREKTLGEAYRTGAGLDISKLLLHPLLPAAGGFKKWILCPDAEIWMFPWNALVLPDGKYFIERHTLTHIVSPRDLLAPARAQADPGPALVIASPNYDLGVTGPENRAQDIKPLAAFGRPWIDSMLPDMEFFSRSQPQIFIGDAATEDLMKKARSPRLLFLATHGLFGRIDPQKMPAGFGFFKENPLVRSMLTFAGCNRKRAPGEKGEDGFLYGSEVLGCDFRGTELVILTACQTAQGDTHAGQSAAGMRQAFQLAGARDVVATLWSVDVAASRKLIADFVNQIGTMIPPVEGLRQAQLDMLHDGTYPHPFYWSPFTITGNGR